ncbi:MAG: glycosyltransferase family 1 protein [Sulfobacillus thermotolerans]|nr:glycosyltransferase family 1 protein [Sulfobacillus thermotolerans]
MWDVTTGGILLQVVVDALLYHPQSAGIGRYIASLVEAYVAQFAMVDQVMAIGLPGQVLPGGTMVVPPGNLHHSRERMMFEQWQLHKWLRQTSYDVVHFPDYQVPVLRRVRHSVATVHDLVAYKYPQMFPWAKSQVKRRMLAWSVRAADHIIVPSQATADDLHEILKVPRERVTVVPHGVIRRGIPSAMSLNSRPYFVAVGTIEPRKNFQRVIEAFAQLVDKQKLRGQVDLLIAGKKGWLYEPVLEAPSRLGIAEQVRFLDYVSEDDLASLYRHAIALVYPSLYEGFGLPVLEAMGWGAPVICSNRGALAEVAGNAAMIVDPLSVEDIAAHMEQLWTHPEHHDIWAQKGLEHIRSYTWSQTALQTRAVYLQVAR